MDSDILGTKELLKKLCDLPCISGFERNSPVSSIIFEEFSRHCDEVKTDTFGNIIALKKGKPGGINVMLAAHMDEIGLMVTAIDDLGLIKFTTLGGFDHRTLKCQEVTVHGKEDIFGIIGSIPPHMLTPEKKGKAVKLEDMGIDTGYEKCELEGLVKVGDRISIKRKATDLQNDYIAGKSIDDMSGVVALREAMLMLKDFRHSANVYFVATTQEEISALGGAFIAAYGIEPDIAIAVDVGFAKMPELDEHDSLEIGKGAAIAIGPNINRNVYERLRSAAKENGVPYQVQLYSGGNSGTDAAGIQIARSGVATGIALIPLKYMHTSVETVKMDDLISVARLLQSFIISLNKEEFLPF